MITRAAASTAKIADRAAAGVVTHGGLRTVYVVNVYEPDDDDGAEIYVAARGVRGALRIASKDRPTGTQVEIAGRIDLRMVGRDATTRLPRRIKKA